MANPEHIKWLLEGVDSWNSRRSVQDFIPDLSGEDVSARLLDAGVSTLARRPKDVRPDLTDVNLSKSNLMGCDFSSAWLLGADLSGTNLSFARLENAMLFFANIRSAELENANLTDADLMDAKLGQANLTNCTLKGTIIADADLVGANLTDSRLWQASMESRFPPSLGIGPPATPTECITSINDFLQQFKMLQNHYIEANLQNEVVFYFRGESNDTWKLSPGVMRRIPADENSLRKAEGVMLVDLRSRRAEDFVEANFALDQMVVAQHYGLPTRLLDVTRNPLVALFHASEGWNESRTVDGRIHVFAVPKFLVKPFNSDTVSVITNFSRLRRNEQNLLLGRTDVETKDDAKPGYGTELQLGNLYASAMNRLYQFIRLGKPSFQERIDPKDLFRVIVVEPRQSFERIRAQSGAFLISAFHERFEETEIREWTTDLPLYHHYTIAVPGGSKSAISQELAMFNITRETMFPGLDEAARAVTDYYRRP